MHIATCPDCSLEYQFKEQLVGRTVNCSRCHNAFLVPVNSGRRSNQHSATHLNQSGASKVQADQKRSNQVGGNTTSRLAKKNQEQQELDAQILERMKWLYQFRSLAWIPFSIAALLILLMVVTQSVFLFKCYPLVLFLLIGGAILASLGLGLEHNLKTIKNKAEKYCRDCGHEIHEWEVIGKRGSIMRHRHLRNVKMPNLNTQSKKACPYCGKFCFADSIQPVISSLRVPSSFLIALLGVLICYLVTPNQHQPFACVIVGGAVFWSTVIVIGWPLQWVLPVGWELITGKRFRRRSLNLGEPGDIPGWTQKHLYLHGFARTKAPGKIRIVKEGLRGLDLVKKWVFFAIAWSVLGVFFVMPIVFWAQNGSLGIAAIGYAVGVLFLILHAAFLRQKDRARYSVVEIDAASLSITEFKPLFWHSGSTQFPRNSIKQFFVDTTMVERYAGEENHYVGDEVFHSLQMVTAEDRRVTLITTNNSALAELKDLEDELEKFWGLNDVQVAEFASNVTTYAATGASDRKLVTRGQGFNFQIVVLILCCVPAVFFWLGMGAVLGKNAMGRIRDVRSIGSGVRRAPSSSHFSKPVQKNKKREQAPQKPSVVIERERKKEALNRWLAERLKMPITEIKEKPIGELADLLDRESVKPDEIAAFGLFISFPMKKGEVNDVGQRKVIKSGFAVSKGNSSGRSSGPFRMQKIHDDLSFLTYNVDYGNGLLVYTDTRKLKFVGEGFAKQAVGEFFVSLEGVVVNGEQRRLAYQMPPDAIALGYLFSSWARDDDQSRQRLESDELYRWMVDRCKLYWGLNVGTNSFSGKQDSKEAKH